jgi:trans-aconitate methyltransferase
MSRWDAQDCHAHSEAQLVWATELIDRLSLRGDERLLDIGCGDSRATAELARRLPRGSVVGLDNSEDLVEFAQGRFASLEFPSLSFRLGDARQLPFSEELDIVFSSATLHWIVDHRPALAGIAKALRPNGRVLLQMGGKGNAAGIIKAVRGLTAELQWANHVAGFEFPYGFHGVTEYREWLVAAGLTPVRVELIPKDMVKETEADLAGWGRTTWMPYTHRVPEDLREEFIRRLVSRYVAAHPPTPDGWIHVAMVRLEVEAVRQ